MGLIDLDEFLRQNCIDRMEGKSCEECKHHVLVVSCERLMEQPTIDPVKHGRWIDRRSIAAMNRYECSACKRTASVDEFMGKPMYAYCPWCGARMDVPDNDVGEMEGEE